MIIILYIYVHLSICAFVGDMCVCSMHKSSSTLAIRIILLLLYFECSYEHIPFDGFIFIRKVQFSSLISLFLTKGHCRRSDLSLASPLP